MNKIFEQITEDTSINEEKNHVVIKFPTLGKVYLFNTTMTRVQLVDKSQAVIAAVTGRTLLYKDTEIKSTNKIFDWLGIKYTVEFVQMEKSEAGSLVNGVISYFPTT